jgi:tetratricopeptide (TPR) repeat protein
MTLNESAIFEKLFSRFTEGARLSELMRLRTTPYVKYRIPFFYGLIAFEKDFAKIEDFIDGTYEGTPINSRRWLALLSLVSRFSQLAMPYKVFQSLVGLAEKPDTGTPTGLLGKGAKRAIMFDGQGLAIMHPVLAEELLEKYLKRNDTDNNTNGPMATSLADFCIWVIEELSNEHIKDNAVVQEILIDLFVDREFWPDSVKAKPFSPLISQIPSKEGQKRVLQFLTEAFPANAHFSNHLGRHINLTESGTFEEAEKAISRAIHLDPNNSIHRHALGMVYRFEAKRILQERLAADETVIERLDRAQPLISGALERFNEAVELSDASNYPLVTPMQMVFNSLDRVLFLAKKSNFGEILSDDTGVGEWCRNLLDEATMLLEKLHKLEAGSPKSEHRQKLDAEYQKILGNYGEMISGLQQLLLRPGVNKGAIRRLLVQGYLGKKEQRSVASQRAICTLMLQNLREGPISEFDIRTWFRAYRETPDFTISEAIERFTEWSLITDISDTHYYLHILHFMQSKLGIRVSQRESLEQLALMRRIQTGLVSKRSFEWLGNSKESGQLSIVSHAMLGDWDSASGFFKNSDLLARVPATVSKISSPQSGKVDIGGIEAFFVPRSDFINPHDLNAKVDCYVGFSYEGPRAWEVRRRERH